MIYVCPLSLISAEYKFVHSSVDDFSERFTTFPIFLLYRFWWIKMNIKRQRRLVGLQREGWRQSARIPLDGASVEHARRGGIHDGRCAERRWHRAGCHADSLTRRKPIPSMPPACLAGVTHFRQIAWRSSQRRTLRCWKRRTGNTIRYDTVDWSALFTTNGSILYKYTIENNLTKKTEKKKEKRKETHTNKWHVCT